MVGRCTGRVAGHSPRRAMGPSVSAEFANDSLPFQEGVVSPRAYVSEAVVADLAARLTPTEQAVIATLDRVRLATVTQLERLHFLPNGTDRTAARRARRTLARLAERRVVVRLERPVGGVRSGSAGHVYALDVAGQRLASVCGPAGGARVRRPWTPGRSFLAHTVAVTELYVRLREAERTGSLELVAFDAEPACWRAFTGIGGARVMLKPDAFVRVAAGEFEHFCFVEVDRATQSVPALARKLAVYRRFYATGREQERFGLFPQVVILAPSEARKQVVVDVCGAQPPDSWPLWQVARYDDALATLTGETS